MAKVTDQEIQEMAVKIEKELMNYLLTSEGACGLTIKAAQNICYYNREYLWTIVDSFLVKKGLR